MRSQRTSLVPLFRLGDVVTKVKMQVDDTLDGSGAVVIPDDNPEEVHPGYGEEAVFAMIKLLQSPPQNDIKTEEDELELDDLEFEPDMERKIWEKVKIKHVKNKQHALRALNYS